MTGFIDVHSHILPGVDDGSRDWDMTAGMLKKAYAQGVRTIVATPHNYPGGRLLDIPKVKALYSGAQRMAREIADDFDVLLGNEIYFREGIPEEISDGRILTMAESDYILVEFSPGEHYDVIFKGLKGLAESGYYPIIAHVERVRVLMESETRLKELRELGCYMQVNTEDIMGGFFQRKAAKLQKLAEKGYVHLLGSDCHNLDSRPPLMADCMECLKKRLGGETYQRLAVTNPERFLAKKYM